MYKPLLLINKHSLATQLEQMINSAIINNPWLVTEDDADSTDQENLKRIVDMMSRKGLRPITPEEYAAKLKSSRG